MFFKKTLQEKTLQNLAKEMRKIDICMFATHTDDGTIAVRPMSNNKDVDYDGDSYFFTSDDQHIVGHIAQNPKVTLSFQTDKMLYIAITGKGQLIRDKAVMQKHWVPDLERWFEQGVDTPGLVMIAVKGEKLKYWDKMDEGELTLS